MKSKDTHQLLKAIVFAAEKHRYQKRKDADKTPYINHPLNVAFTLVEIGKEEDQTLLIAAVLHDTVEDTETTPEEIENLFGKEVLSIVMEVTDDKSLPKEERKRLQVINAPHKSVSAKKLKLADKISNVTDIIYHAPDDWSLKQKLDYLLWAEQVMEGIKGVNHLLENHLAETIAKGKLLFLEDKSSV
ncbi:MAG: HD domain-containing protein [Bacteroidota bacterium]